LHVRRYPRAWLEQKQTLRWSSCKRDVSAVLSLTADNAPRRKERSCAIKTAAKPHATISDMALRVLSQNTPEGRSSQGSSSVAIPFVKPSTSGGAGAAHDRSVSFQQQVTYVGATPTEVFQELSKCHDPKHEPSTFALRREAQICMQAMILVLPKSIHGSVQPHSPQLCLHAKHEELNPSPLSQKKCAPHRTTR